MVSGYQPGMDAQLRADLIFRHGGSDQTLATATSTVPVGMQGAGNIDTMVSAAAVPGTSGDLLVLKVQMTAGAQGFIELGTSLTLPP